MLTAEKKKGPLTIQTVYFCEDPAAYKTDADLCLFAGVAKKGRYSVPHTTLLLDLTQSPEALRSAMCAGHRNDINKMLKGKVPLECREVSDDAAVEEFIALHHAFTESKGLRPANRAHVEHFMRTGHGLLLRSANTETGTIYNYAMWLYDGPRALLYLLATTFRSLPGEEKKLAGTAAKYSQYSAMLLLGARGVRVMDMGGVSLGRHSDGREGIDAFKRRFGGTVYHQYLSVEGKSLPGKLLAPLYYYKNRNI